LYPILRRYREQTYNPPSRNIQQTTIFCRSDIFNPHTFLIGNTKMVMSSKTCTVEFAIKKVVVLMQVGF
jgi:hypothetical protein